MNNNIKNSTANDNLNTDLPAELESQDQSTQDLALQALDSEKVKDIAKNINISETTAIISFGSAAQQQLTNIANDMLKDVQSKDSGNAGDLLSKMVLTLQGFQGEEKKLREKPSFFTRLFGGKQHAFKKFLQQYETVSNQIDQISNTLEERKQKLLLDITSLDELYAATLDYYHELRYFIAGAELKLQEVDTTDLPNLKSIAEKSQDMADAQRLRDLQSQRDELEKRCHDLKLTKQVSMQALPSIRMVQENDKGLVNKINSTIINTIPLWQQQLAQSVAIYRSGEAANALKASSDLTNQLLTSNAETLKTANKESRTQIERGAFDIDAVEKANQLLIDTIEESIQIHEHAKENRKQAELRLEDAEKALKSSIISTSTLTIR